MASTAQPDDYPTWPPPEWADWTQPDPKTVDEQLKTEISEKERKDAWKKAATTVKTDYDDLMKQWQDAMDSILVYAGLFSAVLTAFNVLSYPLLQPDPADSMLAALQQISAQLNSFSVNPSFINSTQPVRSPDELRPPFHASASAIWINTLWFVSLAAASIALMVKQWLFEGSKGLSGTSLEAARRRQYRLNSLIKWRVEAIVLVPSVLLQVALFLFLAGLLCLLWTVHKTVAAVVTALVGALFAFVLVTTVLPIFTSDCCYRSPQAYSVFMLSRLVWSGAGKFAEALMRLCARVILWLLSFISRFRDRLPVLQHWQSPVLDFYQYCDDWKMGQISTWKGAEQTEVARDDGLLDRRIAITAYTTTFATEHLETLHILLSDLPYDQVFSCFPEIYHSWIDLWGPSNPVGRSRKLAKLLLGKPFSCALRRVLTIDPSQRDQALGNDWTKLSSEYLLSSYNTEEYLPLSNEIMSILAHLSIGDSAFAKKTCSLLYRGFCRATNYEDSMTFAMTYDALRDPMAVARYNVTVIYGAESKPHEHVDMFGVICLSLQSTRLALTNDNADLSQEQEAWIRSKSRSLLSCLVKKMTEVTDEHSWLSFTDIVLELYHTCTQVSRGFEMVPEEFLAIHMPTEVSADDFIRRYIDYRLVHLKSVIQQQGNHEEEHGQ